MYTARPEGAMKCARVVLLLAGTLFWSACGQQSREVAPGPRPASTTTAAAAPSERGSIRVTDASDRLLFRLKADQDGYKVYGGGDQLLARLKVESDRVKAEDAAGQPLLKLKHKDKKGKAEDQSGAVLFTVKPHSTKAGDFKLETAAGALLYRLKKESYGYKVTDAQDQTLFKMKAASDRVIADGPDGRKRMEVKGSSAALAACAVALESFDLPRRAALFAYLTHFEGKTP